MEIVHNDILIERWTQCLRVLSDLPEHARIEHFDMSLFIEDTDCGTIGCAAGFCALDPWFQANGLSVEFSEQWDGYLLTNTSLEEFFGEKGATSIFNNRRTRPIETVMEEVREHIEWLKKDE